MERLPGAHCYELYAGSELFSDLQEAELGTFYLTDYLVRHFDRLILQGLGIAAHPELRDAYFGNYTRVIHLVQEPDGELETAARRAAGVAGVAVRTAHLRLRRVGILARRPPDTRAGGVSMVAQGETAGGRRRRRRDGGADLVIICWRDIPAQVNAGSGEHKVQRIPAPSLPARHRQRRDGGGDVLGVAVHR